LAPWRHTHFNSSRQRPAVVCCTWPVIKQLIPASRRRSGSGSSRVRLAPQSEGTSQLHEGGQDGPRHVWRLAGCCNRWRAMGRGMAAVAGDHTRAPGDLGQNPLTGGPRRESSGRLVGRTSVGVHMSAVHREGAGGSSQLHGLGWVGRSGPRKELII
jgi:hypothetical protein